MAKRTEKLTPGTSWASQGNTILTASIMFQKERDKNLVIFAGWHALILFISQFIYLFILFLELHPVFSLTVSVFQCSV